MKRKIGIVLLVVLCLSLIGCSKSNNDDNLSGQIMELRVSGGGAMTEEQYEKSKNTYLIDANGQVTDKNGITKQLSDKDTKTICDYYKKFRSGDVTTTNNDIMDGPTYELIVLAKESEEGRADNSLVFEWSFNKQDSYVKEIRDIIGNYFN
jgi:hypothetical protein